VIALVIYLGIGTVMHIDCPFPKALSVTVNATHATTFSTQLHCDTDELSYRRGYLDS
jgi:hypothetical protein